MEALSSKNVVRATRWKENCSPKVAIKRAYGKPLMRGLVKSLEDAKLDRAFQMLSKEVLNRVRKQISQTAFSDAAKKRLSKALKVKFGPSSLQIVVKDPLWRYLLDGRKAREMTWLRKARRPIPIVTETGKVIFRSGQPGEVKSGPRAGSKPISTFWPGSR